MESKEIKYIYQLVLFLVSCWCWMLNAECWMLNAECWMLNESIIKEDFGIFSRRPTIVAEKKVTSVSFERFKTIIIYIENEEIKKVKFQILSLGVLLCIYFLEIILHNILVTNTRYCIQTLHSNLAFNQPYNSTHDFDFWLVSEAAVEAQPTSDILTYRQSTFGQLKLA